MLNLNFVNFPILTTERLTLRQIKASDANEMYHLRSDEKVMEYIGRPRAKSVIEAAALIQKANEATVKQEGITWAITQKNYTKLIGNISYWRLMREHDRAEMGYILHPDYQGQGLMQEALSAVLHYGYHTLKLHSVEAHVDPNNIASIKLLERNNFVREGYYRENHYYDGKYQDTAVYSLILTEQ